jgi:hypothetical protein
MRKITQTELTAKKAQGLPPNASGATQVLDLEPIAARRGAVHRVAIVRQWISKARDCPGKTKACAGIAMQPKSDSSTETRVELELRTREYLTEAEVDSLIEAAKWQRLNSLRRSSSIPRC